MSLKSPEIFKRPLTDFDRRDLPPLGTDEHGEAVLQRVMLDYASKGYTAAVSIDEDWVRGSLYNCTRDSSDRELAVGKGR